MKTRFYSSHVRLNGYMDSKQNVYLEPFMRENWELYKEEKDEKFKNVTPYNVPKLNWKPPQRDYVPNRWAGIVLNRRKHDSVLILFYLKIV